MKKVQPIYAQAETALRQRYVSQVQSRRWLDYPKTIQLETLARCNAACNFCPYPTLERIGARMTPQLVGRLLAEVASWPSHPLQIGFNGVNEPLLDKNLFEYMREASRLLPQTALKIHSNGQALTERAIDELDAIPTFFKLFISFNEYDPDKYRETMALDQAKTLERLSYLHERVARGVSFSVGISRVGESDLREDQIFVDWCRQKFPLFSRVSVSSRFTWLGTLGRGAQELTPETGCDQWFNLAVDAEGLIQFCCVDPAGNPEYSVHERSLYELYNVPERRAVRERVVFRREVDHCKYCTLHMPGQAYEGRIGTDRTLEVEEADVRPIASRLPIAS